MSFGKTPTLLIVVFVALIGLLYVSHKRVSTCAVVGSTLIVGTNAEYPPFSFIENDQIVGFDIDIIREIAQRLAKKIDIQNMSFAALVPELQLGTVHAAAAGITPSEEKGKRVLFTTVYFAGDPLMAVQLKEKSPITSGKGFKGKIVSVNQGYTADQYLSKLEGFEVIRLSSPLVTTGIMTLQSKQADAYVASKTALQPYFAKQQRDLYQATPLEGTEETYALAVSKKYPKLYEDMQRELTKMLQDGTIETLKKKWGLA